MKHTIRFFYSLAGHVSACSQHTIANDGTGRQRWPAERFEGTRAEAETYVARVCAEAMGGLRGEIASAKGETGPFRSRSI